MLLETFVGVVNAHAPPWDTPPTQATSLRPKAQSTACNRLEWVVAPLSWFAKVYSWKKIQTDERALMSLIETAECTLYNSEVRQWWIWGLETNVVFS